MRTIGLPCVHSYVTVTVSVCAAPLTVIVAYDTAFHEQLPTQFPAFDAKGFYDNLPHLIEPGARSNATLQGAYLIMAVRAVGLDVAPMSGFDNYQLDNLFFSGTRWKSNFLVALGHGEPSALPARGPRLSFDEACRFE